MEFDSDSIVADLHDGDVASNINSYIKINYHYNKIKKFVSKKLIFGKDYHLDGNGSDDDLYDDWDDATSKEL